MPVSGLLHRTIGTIRECALITKDILVACRETGRDSLLGAEVGIQFEGALTASARRGRYAPVAIRPLPVGLRRSQQLGAAQTVAR